MTEAEWKNGIDPTPMLRVARGKASDRKLRLLAAACFGRLVALLPDPRQRRGIEMLEQLAEGTVTQAECRGVMAEVRRAIPPDDRIAGSPPTDHLHYIALMLYREFCSSSIAVHAIHAADGLADGVAERREQARLIRCIFGNPFRPTAVDPRWLSPTTASLAQSIYEERTFDRLPILAETLEHAGCDRSDLLAHCRDGAPHARGCWVIDLILGRE
jgi:hypothetical protein